eukprot:gene2498-2844_t
MYKAYNKIMILARDLNTQIEVPEFTFIGGDLQGKAALMEAFLGHPLGDISGLLRPLIVSLVNNPDFEKPRVTVKRDRFLTGFEVDKVVELGQVPAEITRRNVASTTPIKITYEYRHCLNMGLIATPGVTTTVDEALLAFTKPVHRILVFVEACNDHPTIIELAKRLDPKLDRSVFVFNRLADHLVTFSAARDLNRFLNAPNQDAATFFATLPAAGTCPSKDSIAAACEQNHRNDVEVLERLQYDKRFERNIGLSSFRHYVSELTWRRYQEAIPEVLKRLRAFRKSSEDQLGKLRTQLDNMNAGKLRVIASNYVMEFLQSIEKLVVGTLEGNPSLNGQTLIEEKAANETGEWIGADHRAITLDPATIKVPFHESKVYGGQQFERLLAEFRAVTESVELGELSFDEIATSLGANHPANVSVFAWAASDIAQKKSREVLHPLVEQLFRRAVYILRRLVDIVDRMIENKRKIQLRRAASSPTFESAPITLNSLRPIGGGSIMANTASSHSSSHSNHSSGSSHHSSSSSSSQSLVNIDDHPYFTHSIKEMYFRFIDQIVHTCKSKCVDEFYNTRLIYWELQGNEDLKALAESSDPKTSQEETKKIVSNLAAKLFKDIRSRITKNIMLKCYNYFLIPMQTDLWGEVQGKITILSDSMLEELFEVAVTKDRLKEDERHLGQITNQFLQQEEGFLLAANTFSHPIM